MQHQGHYWSNPRSSRRDIENKHVLYKVMRRLTLFIPDVTSAPPHVNDQETYM